MTISEWATREAAKAWRRHPDHAEAQGKGRHAYYEQYTMFTCPDPQVSQYPQDEDA